MIDAAFSGQGAPGIAIVMVLASLFESFEDLNTDAATARTANRPADLPARTDAGRSARGFVRLFVAMHGDYDRIARALDCSYDTARRFRRNFGLPSIPPLLTSAHHATFERLLAASDDDLASWGNAMRRYWKARPARGPRGAELAEFLRISGG